MVLLPHRPQLCFQVLPPRERLATLPVQSDELLGQKLQLGLIPPQLLPQKLPLPLPLLLISQLNPQKLALPLLLAEQKFPLLERDERLLLHRQAGLLVTQGRIGLQATQAGRQCPQPVNLFLVLTPLPVQHTQLVA